MFWVSCEKRANFFNSETLLVILKENCFLKRWFQLPQFAKNRTEKICFSKYCMLLSVSELFFGKKIYDKRGDVSSRRVTRAGGGGGPHVLR